MIRSVTEPVFTCVQVSPESIERKTPFAAAVRKRRDGVVGSTSRTPAPDGVPRSAAIFVQVAALSSDRKMPVPASTAYTRDGVTGSTASAASTRLGRVSPTEIQDPPPSVVFQMPQPGPPTYSVVG